MKLISILSDIVLNESIKDDVVICDKCNWQWSISDGGKDPYLCHKCGHDNTPINEDLRDWFKEKWVNIGKKVDGKHPPCGTSGKKKGYAKCVPAAKAATMSKKEKESATNRKRKAQNAADRGGKDSAGQGKAPINVSTKAKNEQMTLEEKLNLFLERNCPNDPGKWSASKAAAKSKFDVYPCVPLDSEALTKDGWKKYHELTVGENILSYNRDTGVNEWTPILALQYYEDAPIIRLFKSKTNFDLKCTPNHKWVLDSANAKYPDNLVEAQNVTTHMKIKTSAPIKEENQLGVDLQSFSKFDSWVQNLKKEDAGIEDVWCPTTKNETWVMRQNGYVTITGNSAYANGWAAKNYKGKGGTWKKCNEGEMNALCEDCWDGYKQVGGKMKNGKQVPNCVPINEEEISPKNEREMIEGIAEIVRGIKDIDNRKESAKKQIKQLKAEGIKFDVKEFLSLCGFKSGLKEGQYDDEDEGAGYNLVKQNPFNIQKLVDKGIIFVGLPGDGEGGIGKHKFPGDSSIITLYNLKALPPDPWMIISAKNPRPTDIPYVQKDQYGLFYNGKYNQILWGIEKKGFKPKDFYLNLKEGSGMPDRGSYIESESEEIERTSDDLDISYEDIRDSLMNGKEITLEDKIWSRLENTDSYHIKDKEEAIKLANNYGKDWKSIEDAEETPPALILQYEPNKYYLVGGNTRLMFAKANKTNPKAILGVIDQEIDEYDVETIQEFQDFKQFIREYATLLTEGDCNCITEAEYQGRKVQLGKPMQGDVKKFKVYVKNPAGKVVKVNFGQKGMVIKKNNPKRRKSFRARMNCDNPGPRTKANYWSCRKW